MACSQCTDKMIRKCCTGAGYFAGPTDADAQGIVDRAAVDSIKAEIIKGRLAALEHPGLDPDEAYWDVAAAHWDADEGLQLEIHERLPGVLAPEYVLATFIDFLSAGPADAGVEYNPTRMPSDPTDGSTFFMYHPDGGAGGIDNDADGLVDGGDAPSDPTDGGAGSGEWGGRGIDNDADGMVAVDPDGGVPTRYGSGMPHLGFLTMNAAGELSVESPGGSNGVGGQCDCCGCGPIDCDKCTQRVMDKCCPSMGFTGDAEVEGP
jgi:hypothetical protein